MITLGFTAGGGRPELAIACAADDHGLEQPWFAGDDFDVTEVLGSQAERADDDTGGDPGPGDDATGEIGIVPHGKGLGIQEWQWIAEFIMAVVERHGEIPDGTDAGTEVGKASPPCGAVTSQDQDPRAALLLPRLQEDNAVTVAGLARRPGRSASVFSRRFRRVNGVSPGVYRKSAESLA